MMRKYWLIRLEQGLERSDSMLLPWENVVKGSMLRILIFNDIPSLRAQPRATPRQARGNLFGLAASLKRLPQELSRLRNDGVLV